LNSRGDAAKLAAMGIQYVSVEDAIPRAGLRMVVVGKVPSPWGEAAKGFFHIKGLDFAAVRLAYDDPALTAWAGQSSAPVVFFDGEAPRSGWAEILMLAERLAPSPPLLSLEPNARGREIELANAFCGERGLGWTRRLQLVHAGARKIGGFPERVGAYLGGKYGYDAAQAATYTPRVCELLGRFAAALRASSGPYYFGERLTAVDVYGATFMALFQPLPDAVCAMDPWARAAFEYLDAETRAALDPVLLEHRDRMYARHLALPLSL
jgi:glutathione S-transferase